MNFEKPNLNQDTENTSDSKKISKRDFLRKSLGFAAAGLITKGIVDILPKWEDKKGESDEDSDFKVKEPILKDEEFLDEQDSEDSSMDQETQTEIIGWKEFKKIKPEIEYKEIVPKLRIENLKMPDDVGRYGATTYLGKILRTLRYKNVTDAVEQRYNLPTGVLLAMIMEESTGVDLLPNARGDGGFGLCHMQGSTAVEYGLKTFCNCDSLVCNGKDERSCKDSNNNLQNHAKELANFIQENREDRKKLVEADERLNILLNIDAAGRMLASGISGPKLSGKLSDLGPFRRSIARYSGSYNYEKYWADITRNMNDLMNPEYLSKVEEIFNKKNINLKINGEKADFQKYLEAFQEQNLNYGLEEYKKLKRYLPKNSVQVMATYKDYI